MKSRKMICAGHVARMGIMKNSYKIMVGKPEVKRSFGRLGSDRVIILKRMSNM
jgi:hypothetical protein